MLNIMIEHLQGMGTVLLGISSILILFAIVAGILKMGKSKDSGGNRSTFLLLVVLPVLLGVAISWLYAYVAHASKGQRTATDTNELVKDKSDEIADRANWHKFLIARTDYYDLIVVTQYADKSKRHLETIAYKKDSKQNPILREVRIAESLGSESEWLKYHQGIVEESKKLTSVGSPTSYVNQF